MQACPDDRDRITQHRVALATALGHACVENTYGYLAATAEGHDPRRPVEDRTEVVPAPLLGRTGVEAHSNANLDVTPRLGVEAALCRHRRIQGRASGGECRGEGVPGGREHVAVAGLDRSPEDLVVTKVLAGRPKDLEDVRGILRQAPETSRNGKRQPGFS